MKAITIITMENLEGLAFLNDRIILFESYMLLDKNKLRQNLIL